MMSSATTECQTSLIINNNNNQHYAMTHVHAQATVAHIM